MEIKKTIKPEIRLDSKKRILIVSVVDSVTTHSTLQPIGKAGKIMKQTHNIAGLRLKRLRDVAAGNGKKGRFDRSVTIPSYRLAKKTSAIISKETGVTISPLIIGGKIQGVYPPIGIVIDGKHIKIKTKNGRK